jgi:hypothetical protein
MSVTEIVSDLSNCGKSPKRTTEDKIAQQHEQQLHIAKIPSYVWTALLLLI